jgi:type I restriction enzyme R subunit
MQDRDDFDLTAGRGIAAREFPIKSGCGLADYLLYLNRKAIGVVEAKAEGTLTGVEAQSAKHAADLPDNLPAHPRPLPFLFESDGTVTYFINGLDPKGKRRDSFGRLREPRGPRADSNLHARSLPVQQRVVSARLTSALGSRKC